MPDPDYKALCAELLAALEIQLDELRFNNRLCVRARASLAQPEPVAPTDEELDELFVDIDQGAAALNWRTYARAVLAKWGTPPPQPVWADIHYAWELEDAEGEWQAGGSADSLDDVQREGNRYLQTYSQDGPHKLVIQRHCVSTIEEVTND